MATTTRALANAGLLTIATASLLSIGCATGGGLRPSIGSGSGFGAGARPDFGRRFEETAPKIGEVMPNLQIYDADGKELWLHDALRGHPSVLILGCLT